jgi:hypothetical protein
MPDLNLGQIAGDERLVVLPEPVGDSAHRTLGDQQLTSRVGERVLHIASRKTTVIHLLDQGIEHLTVAVEEVHQRRAERLRTATSTNPAAMRSWPPVITVT